VLIDLTEAQEQPACSRKEATHFLFTMTTKNTAYHIAEVKNMATAETSKMYA